MSRLSRREAHAAIRRWYATALTDVDPQVAVSAALRLDEDQLWINGEPVALKSGGRLVAVAIGKAAAEMAAALDSVLSGRLDVGMLLTKDGHQSGAPASWTSFEAAHPIPDERGVEATRQIMELVGGLSADDLLIVLVSGGGSALLEAPREPLTLADIQAVTAALLRAGAPIQDLNAVRSELSEVKGGGLRRLAGDARCVSIILSDVLGNDPTVIASGPTIARNPDPDRALALLAHYGLTHGVPHAVITLLESSAGQTIASTSGANDLFTVVADNETFLAGVARAVEQDGFRVSTALRLVEGEAADVAITFLRVATSSDADVILGGGETTVTVRGDGIGGRNTEFALAAAIDLSESREPRVVASLASDGQDGRIDAAGAIADRDTVSRARALGLDAVSFLDQSDSGTFFQRLGDLVEPGPTGTNVNDVYIAVRFDHE